MPVWISVVLKVYETHFLSQLLLSIIIIILYNDLFAKGLNYSWNGFMFVVQQLAQRFQRERYYNARAALFQNHTLHTEYM